MMPSQPASPSGALEDVVLLDAGAQLQQHDALGRPQPKTMTWTTAVRYPPVPLSAPRAEGSFRRAQVETWSPPRRPNQTTARAHVARFSGSCSTEREKQRKTCARGRLHVFKVHYLSYSMKTFKKHVAASMACWRWALILFIGLGNFTTYRARLDALAGDTLADVSL